MATIFAVLKDPRWQLRLLIGVVFVSLAFLLPSVAKYHGDECFYTDAAIRMTQSGNYWTPYAASGALRFAKPILPYWAVLAGYAVCGINFLGSRIVFLIAGCSVLYFTYRLSLTLFGRPKEAVLAALIMGSNVQLLTISIRSTPDALLCLFVLLSLWGFARIIFQNDMAWKSYGLAYVGAGLAIETRGLPGVGVLLFPFLFCLLFRRGQTRLRQLLEWKAIVLGSLVGLSWFGVMVWLHGRALIDGFYYDQVTENVRDFYFLSPLLNLQGYLTGLLRHFLPWSVLVLAGLILDRRVAGAFWKEHRSQSWFLVGWFLFIMSPFIFGESYRTRYMSVAYPLLAVLLAGLLSRYASVEKVEQWMRRLVAGAAIILIIGGLVLIGAGAMAHIRILAAGALWLCAGAVVAVVLRKRIRWAYGLAVALLALSLFWSVELGLRPIFSKSPAHALVARLLPDDTVRRRVYAMNMSPSYQAQMRVLSQGKLTVVPLTVNAQTPLPPGSTPLLFAETQKSLVPQTGGKVEQVGFSSRRWRGRDFLDFLQTTKQPAAIARNSEPYFVWQE